MNFNPPLLGALLLYTETTILLFFANYKRYGFNFNIVLHITLYELSLEEKLWVEIIGRKLKLEEKRPYP